MDEPAALPSMPRLDRISITPAGKAWAAQKDLGRDIEIDNCGPLVTGVGLWEACSSIYGGLWYKIS